MFDKNQRVEAYYDDGWYNGIVYKVNNDGTYVVHFDDGDVADDIRPDEIRLPQNKNSSLSNNNGSNGNNNKSNDYYDDNEGDDDDDIFGDEFKTTKQKTLTKTENILPPQNLLKLEEILPKVEAFLLPGSSSTPLSILTESKSSNNVNNGDNNENIDNDYDSEINLLPTTRLNELLRELVIGEHVRMCQYLYRDNEDECQVAAEVRQLSNDGLVRISSKQLTESLIEGRSRALALCRLCYGDDSIEYLRAIVDLASVYAMQGLWEQVSQHMAIATQKLQTVIKSLDNSDIRSKSHDAAHYTYTVFNTLREHAIKSRGYITGSFLSELSSDLHLATTSSLASKSCQEKQVEYYLEIFPRGMKNDQKNDDDDDNDNDFNHKEEERDNNNDNDNNDNDIIGINTTNNTNTTTTANNNNNNNKRKKNNKSKDDNNKNSSKTRTIISALCQEVEDFLVKFLGPKSQWNQSLSQFSPPTWGQMVTFLTKESVVIRKWNEYIEKMLLPQNISLYRMAFDLGDKRRLNICHPIELVNNIYNYPSITKTLSGTSLLTNLQKIPIHITLHIDSNTGEVLTYMAPELYHLFNNNKNNMNNNNNNKNQSMIQHIQYELPITWFEFVARILFEMNMNDGINIFEYLNLQILNLISLCNIYSNQINEAEENLKLLLNKIENFNLENECIAIDLYNSISQLMIVKHKQHNENQKERCNKLARKWLTTKEGKQVLIQEMKNIRNYYLEHKKIQLSSVEAEEIATKITIKVRVKYLVELELNDNITRQSLEAASRYMIKTFEILSKLHNNYHITVASSCIAIASIQNIIGVYSESKEWLVKAIRIMEKLKPIPLRAIAFTQTQLSLLLMKLKHPKSAEKVLSAAVDYYSNSAIKKLNHYSRISYNTRGSGSGSGGNGNSNNNNNNHGIGNISGIGGIGVGTNLSGLNVNSQVLQDIEISLDLLKKLMVLNGDNGAKWQAAEYAENMADLADAAYGWDSQESAELRKQAGERQCRVKDWGRAVGNFKKSLEAHHVLYGEKDRRSLAVLKQLQSAEKKRDAEMLTSVIDDNAIDDIENNSVKDEKE